MIDSGTIYSQVRIGSQQTCGITSTGVLKCWGSDGSGQIGNGATTGNQTSPLTIDSGTTYSQIAGGDDHTCGITSAGVLKCWGNDNGGQIGNGTTTGDQESPVEVDSGTKYLQITGGYRHTCGITSAGVLKCWGADFSGQVGNGSVTTGNQESPVEIDSGTLYSQIAAGGTHTCGTTVSGDLKCWGSDSNGQIGNGSTTTANRASPVVIDSGTRYAKISAKTNSTCGITTGGVLKCWGEDSSGKIGNGSTTTADQELPSVIDPGTTYSQIALGHFHMCGITSAGVLKCWGSDSNAKLGNGSTTGDQSSPVAIDRNRIQTGIYQKISAGGNHTCGITSAGVLKCWGYDNSGQLGNGAITGNQTSPVVIDSGTLYSQISGGSNHTCGITSGGLLKCWGSDAQGQLGNGSTTTANQASPVIIDSGLRYSQISANLNHTCGIAEGGVLKCWGSDTNGQLGNGAGGSTTSPVEIDSGIPYSQVAAGPTHSCGITGGGVLKCWGDDTYGQVGNGVGGSTTTPVEIDSGVKYTQITTGYLFSCGITDAGALKCWGDDTYFTLGNGVGGSTTTPFEINVGTPYMQVSAGDLHACGITRAGDLRCWGYDVMGQVGNGAGGSPNSPTLINSGTPYLRISGGGNHTCGITSTGVLKCWGDDTYGQVGNGAITGNQTSPVTIR